jgi:hypothetical protein
MPCLLTMILSMTRQWKLMMVKTPVNSVVSWPLLWQCLPVPRHFSFWDSLISTPVLILIDSGSSSSFISSKLVAQLSLQSTVCSTLSVRVANGASLPCSAIIPRAVWHIDQYQF